MNEDWQHDATPPVPGDREPLPFRIWMVERYRQLGRSVILASDAIKRLSRMKIDFVLYPPPIGKPKPAVVEKRPYPNDPPTNRIYPTSFDSWCNEYAQPIKTSQVRHQRTRRTRRR